MGACHRGIYLCGVSLHSFIGRNKNNQDKNRALQVGRRVGTGAFGCRVRGVTHMALLPLVRQKRRGSRIERPENRPFLGLRFALDVFVLEKGENVLREEEDC